MARCFPLLLLVGIAAGCARTPAQIDPNDKFITRQEWQQMPDPEKYDPYTLQHLQDEEPEVEPGDSPP